MVVDKIDGLQGSQSSYGSYTIDAIEARRAVDADRTSCRLESEGRDGRPTFVSASIFVARLCGLKKSGVQKAWIKKFDSWTKS